MVAKTLEKFVGRFTESEPNDDPEHPKTERGVNIRLFECSECAITYVSESMDSCSQCGKPVTAIQNERDLGLIGSNPY